MSELKIYGHDPTTTAWGTPTPQREPKLKVTVNWATRIVESPRSGLEYRTPLTTEPRYEIEGTDFVLTDESYATLSQAFQSTGGRARSFPFKNPIDYYCTAIPEVFSNGISQKGILVPLGDGTGRIVKQFHCNGVATYKTVLHPIPDTLRVWDNGVEITGLTVDEITGLVTGFTGENWKECSCEYRGRYRFDVSELQLTQIKRALDEFDINVYQTVNFRLIEDAYVKIAGLLYPVDWGVSIDYDILNIPLPDITYSEKIPSRIEKSGSQKELRESLCKNGQYLTLEQGNTNWTDTQAFLTIFNVCKGQLNDIKFNGKKVRFNSDHVGFEQLGVNVFSVDSVRLLTVPNPTTILFLPFEAGDAPRETDIASFCIYRSEGFLPISEFVLDDVAFIVPANFDVQGCYQLIDNVRVVNVPDNALILYEGGNPNFADGGLNHALQTDYNFNGLTYTVPAAPGGVPITPLSEAIQGFLDMGILGQPHNQILISEMQQRGYGVGSEVSFKIMHLNHGGGNVTLTMNVPQF